MPCGNWFWIALIVLAATLLVLTGCGSADKEQLAMAQEAVETGLNSWKSGEKAEALKSRPEPIDFFDEDWLGGGQLVEFKLIRTFMDTDALPRCAVELTIRKAEAPPTSVTVTYQVVKKPYPVIARDPFN